MRKRGHLTELDPAASPSGDLPLAIRRAYSRAEVWVILVSAGEGECSSLLHRVRDRVPMGDVQLPALPVGVDGAELPSYLRSLRSLRVASADGAKAAGEIAQALTRQHEYRRAFERLLREHSEREVETRLAELAAGVAAANRVHDDSRRTRGWRRT